MPDDPYRHPGGRTCASQATLMCAPVAFIASLTRRAARSR